MNYFEEVKEQLFKFKSLGEEICEHGVLLIGRAPHVARLAWLHKIPPVLTVDEIRKIKDELKMLVSRDYKFFSSTFR